MFVRQKKQGRGFSRVPVWQDCFAILLLRRADLGVVGEVQIVVAPTIEVDPTLNDSVYRKPWVHRDPQRVETVRRYRYAGRHANPIVTSAQSSSVIDRVHCSAEVAPE